jgi:hypothetical protein
MLPRAPGVPLLFRTTLSACIFISLILVVFAASCQEEQPPPPPAAHRASPTAQKGAEAAGSGGDSAPAATRRKLVLTYSVTIETSELERVFREVNRLAEQAGGYITETSQQQMDDGSRQGRLAFRLPPKVVGSFLDQVRALGKVLKEASTGKDATEEYTDLEARLNNAKVSEQRLLGFLTDRTQKLADVLEVEREVSRVRGDIESMEAKKRNLDLLTQTVAVAVEVVEPPSAAPALRQVWFPIKTAFGEGLIIFAKSVKVMIIFVAAITPWVVLLAALTLAVIIITQYAIRRRMRRRSRG